MNLLHRGSWWATRLVVGALGTAMLVALWAAIPLLHEPLAGVALGNDGYSYTSVTSFQTDCANEPAPSLFFECTFPLEGESLHLRLKYTDPMRNYWTGCTATYQGATFRCQSSMQAPQFALIDPEAVGLSAERVAQLRRQHAIINLHEAQWMYVVQGGAWALALVAGLRTVRRELTPFSVAGGLTMAFFTYWVALVGLLIYFGTMQMLD